MIFSPFYANKEKKNKSYFELDSLLYSKLCFFHQDVPPVVTDPAKLFPFSTKIGEYWSGEDIDVKKDANKELKGLKDIPMQDSIPPVDSALNMADTG